MRRVTLWIAIALLIGGAAVAEEFPATTVTTLPTPLDGAWLFRIGHDPSWASPFRERRNWQRVHVPSPWEEQGFAGYNGHAWYRLPFFISSQLAGEMLGIDLGTIGDADEVFVNGRRIGATGDFPPRFVKATLAHRFYLVPPAALRFGEYNEIAIHVYNATRFGGLLGPPPSIDRYASILRRQVLRDVLAYCLFAFLVTLAALQTVFLFTHRERLEHLSLAIFLIAAGAYVLTYTTWGPAALIGLDTTFRLNVVTFLASVALFPSVALRLAGKSIPPLLVALQTLLALGAAFALAWPEEGDLYLWVHLAEGALVVVAAVAARAVAEMFRRRNPWALWVALTTGFVLVLVGIDVLVDLGLVARRLIIVGELYAPLALAPLAVVLSLASGYEWARARWGEPADLNAGILPRDRFLVRLAVVLEQSRTGGVPPVLALMRLQGTDRDGDAEGTVADALGTLRRALRQIDLLGRYDHTTLLVLLADTEERAAVATLERLRRAVADSAGKGRGAVKVAVGLAQYRRTRHTAAKELLAEAEAALYAALSEGGDCTATAP